MFHFPFFGSVFPKGGCYIRSLAMFSCLLSIAVIYHFHLVLVEAGKADFSLTAESWWVDNLIRNPVLIPYTLGSKLLDKIYLDTTFATKSDAYQTFASKAEGIRELLEKVQTYPDNTLFYLRVWTFGYEDVWLALSAALNTRVICIIFYSFWHGE